MSQTFHFKQNNRYVTVNFQQYDIVLTPLGGVAIVTKMDRGQTGIDVSLQYLREGTDRERNAWWDSSELTKLVDIRDTLQDKGIL